MRLFPLFMFLVVSCASAAPAGRVTTPDVRPSAAPSRPEKVAVRLGILRLRIADPLYGLDFTPKYTDRRRLPRVSLSRLRRKIPYMRGSRLRHHLFVLAVYLWRQAENLEYTLGPRPYEPRERERWKREWQRIKAMKDEAIFHLSYLAGLKKTSPAVLEHLAYYLASRDPARAAALLERLMADSRVSRPQVYRLDLASLYLQTGRVQKALSILKNESTESSRRAAFITAAAGLWQTVFSPAGSFEKWCASVPRQFRSSGQFRDLMARAVLYLGPDEAQLRECLPDPEARQYVLSAIQLLRKRFDVLPMATLSDYSARNMLKLLEKLRFYTAPCLKSGTSSVQSSILIEPGPRLRSPRKCLSRLISHIHLALPVDRTVTVEFSAEITVEQAVH